MESIDGVRNVFPQLVIVDLSMPGMNGLDFISHFRSLDRGNAPEAVIALLTNTPEQALRSGLMENVTLLTKPLTYQALDELLRIQFPTNFSKQAASRAHPRGTSTSSDLSFFEEYQ
jgi:CheY-like chemotaxis protein